MLDNKNYKVLLIEDDKLDQLAFTKMIQEDKLHYSLTLADSVKQANNILSNHTFDVIVADYSLQDGTAFDIIGLTKETPVIFATGTGNEKLAVQAMKAGAYDYLIKNPSRSYLSILPVIIENAIAHSKMANKIKAYHENLEELVKERTDELQQEKELLSITLSSMTDGVIVIDQNKNVILLNKVAEKLTGNKLDNSKEKNINEILQLINAQTREPIENPVEKVLSTGRVHTMIDPGILSVTDTEEYPISIAAAPICKVEGTICGTVILIHDRSQEHIVDQMKTDFISSVSHELRTPLTSIKAYTETILRDQNMSEEQKRTFLITIEKESNRLAELVNGLLDISKLNSGQFEAIKQEINIVKIVENIITSLKCTAEKKNITINKYIVSTIPQLWGHESKIRSLITNLISNAMKFTSSGGTITVKLEYENDILQLSVSDTGIGIPPKDIPHIFERFYRVQHEDAQIPGTGLGLAIVKEVATLHGGKVAVESELNKGTTFIVSLPLLEKIEYEPINTMCLS